MDNSLYEALGAVSYIYIALAVILALVYLLLTALAMVKILRILHYWLPILGVIPLLSGIVLTSAAPADYYRLPIPKRLFRLWPIVTFAMIFVPGLGLLSRVINGLCLGYVYTLIYLKVFGTNIQTERVLGFVSGFIPFVAAIRFFSIK